ncbi:MFS transporter [Paraburkholderia flava]|uniref:MFS transporter n=1 Tax=Paraburkholderia flava TaxID=2547393 RepID=UPI00105B242A|nr:MFS transporter [Paraburkholderia flava]
MTESPVLTHPIQVVSRMSAWQLVLFMAATSLGYFVVQLDVSIVNLSLPAIRDYYRIDVAALQWIVNLYTLSFSVALLSAGVLGDRFGSRKFLLAGYGVFALGSLSCGFAPSVSALLAARFLQGIGAAIIVPNSLAAINWAFADNARLRVSLVSIWIAFGGAALTCGPIFGGLINAIASWRYIFFINLPVCALGVLLTLRYVPRTPLRQARPQDWLGQGILLAFASALLLLIINYSDLTPTVRVALLVAAAGGLWLFVRVERRHKYPAIPLEIFRNIGLQKALTYGVLVNFAYFGIVFFASLYFRYYLKMSILDAGLSFIPITLPLIVATMLSGRISRTYGPERAIAVGFALMIPGMFYLAVPALRFDYRLMLPAFALTTFGIGFVPPMITAIAMQSIGPERGGMISAVVNFFRQISGAFGVAVFGILVKSMQMSTAYQYFGMLLSAVAVVLTGCIGSFAIRERRARQMVVPAANG